MSKKIKENKKKNSEKYRVCLINDYYPVIELENPSSIVLDPEMGKMFWADVGENPKIEMSWMDGSRRTPLVTTRLHHPTGLTIDTAMDHALYWVDTKLNVIESIKYDQNNRVVMIRGGERYNTFLSIFRFCV